MKAKLRIPLRRVRGATLTVYITQLADHCYAWRWSAIVPGYSEYWPAENGRDTCANVSSAVDAAVIDMRKHWERLKVECVVLDLDEFLEGWELRC